MKKYEKYFRSMIRGVYVRVESSHSISDLFGFIKTNCSKNIQRLELRSCGVRHIIRIDDRDMEIIADHIKHLEALNLSGGIMFNIQRDHLNSLQTLQIFAKGGESMAWLNRTFTKLKTFRLRVMKGIPIDLENFLQGNNQLVRIFCDGELAARSVLTVNTKLPKAVLRLSESEFEAVEPLCERNIVRHLKEISLVSTFEVCIKLSAPLKLSLTRKLIGMNMVNDLHFTVDTQTIVFFNKMTDVIPHVRSLCITTHVSLMRKDIYAIVKCFPNLNELRINSYVLKVSLKEIIPIFTDGMPKLKKIYLHSTASAWNKKHQIQLATMNDGKITTYSSQLDGISSDKCPSTEVLSCPVCHLRF